MGPGGAPSGEGPRPSAKDIGHRVAAAKALETPLAPKTDGSGDTPTTVGARPETLRDQAVKAVIQPVAEQPTADLPSSEGTVKTNEVTALVDHQSDEQQDETDHHAEPVAESREKNEDVLQQISPGVARLLEDTYDTEAQQPHEGETIPQPDLDRNFDRAAQRVKHFVLGLTVNVSPKKYEDRQASVHEKTTARLEQAALEENPETIDTLAAVGLLDRNTPDGEPVPTPDTFFNRYFYNTGDLARLAQDLQEGLADEDGVVPFDKLNQRLDIVAPFLKQALRKDYDVGSELVRDLAYADAARHHPDRDFVLQLVQKQLQEPVTDPEVTTYLKRLGEQTEAELTEQGLTLRTGEATTDTAARERDPHDQSEVKTWVDAAKGIGVICEGLDGHPNGGKASAMMINSLMQSFTHPPAHETAEAARDWLINQVAKANTFLEAYKRDYSTTEGAKIDNSSLVPHDAATTLNIVYVSNDSVITVNLGNTRAAWQVDGQDMRNLTLDHTATRNKLERNWYGPFKRNQDAEGNDTPIIKDKTRSRDHALRIQDILDQVQDPRNPDHPTTATLTGEEELLWSVRGNHEYIAKFKGDKGDLNNLEADIYPIPPGKHLRVFGFSSEITRLLSRQQISAALEGGSDGDPQTQTENLIKVLEESGDGTPRGKRNHSVDAGAFVLDISPTTAPQTTPEASADDNTHLVQTKLADGEIVEERIPRETIDDVRTAKQGTAS